jgi:hypothetical protein
MKRRRSEMEESEMNGREIEKSEMEESEMNGREISRDDNTYNIAKKIFSQSIKPAKFYLLQLHENSRDIAEEQGVDEYIQGILSIITLHGVEILYGHRNFNSLTEDQLDTVKLYVKSYGYKLVQEPRENFLDWKFVLV